MPDTRSAVKIQGKLTFLPGTTAEQTGARGTSMLHKVDVVRNGVREGHSRGADPNPRRRYPEFLAGDSLLEG